jgi:hypothetical protein
MVREPTFEREREVADGVGAEGVVAGAGQHGGLVEVGHAPSLRRRYQQVHGELPHVAYRERGLRARGRGSGSETSDTGAS